MLSGQLKAGAYAASEVFILPSHSENFGLVIPEAMSFGLPILTTNKVNIWKEIERDGAALVESDNLEGVRQLLKRWMALDACQRPAMSERARASFIKRFSTTNAARSLV